MLIVRCWIVSFVVDKIDSDAFGELTGVDIVYVREESRRFRIRDWDVTRIEEVKAVSRLWRCETH